MSRCVGVMKRRMFRLGLCPFQRGDVPAKNRLMLSRVILDDRADFSSWGSWAKRYLRGICVIFARALLWRLEGSRLGSWWRVLCGGYGMDGLCALVRGFVGWVVLVWEACYGGLG